MVLIKNCLSINSDFSLRNTFRGQISKLETNSNFVGKISVRNIFFEDFNCLKSHWRKKKKKKQRKRKGVESYKRWKTSKESLKDKVEESIGSLLINLTKLELDEKHKKCLLVLIDLRLLIATGVVDPPKDTVRERETVLIWILGKTQSRFHVFFSFFL